MSDSKGPPKATDIISNLHKSLNHLEKQRPETFPAELGALRDALSDVAKSHVFEHLDKLLPDLAPQIWVPWPKQDEESEKNKDERKVK